MLIALAFLAAAPLEFADQAMPGLWIGAPTPFTGLPATNYLQADFDDDGEIDLLLPGAVYFQRQGLFPEAMRVLWPAGHTGGEADGFGSALYVRTHNWLSVYTYVEGQWHTQSSQPVEWPGTQLQGAPQTGGDRPTHFRRFAHDLDGDHIPELLDLDARGIHVFRLQGGRYEPAGILDILPPMTLAPAGPQEIWPAGSRRIVLPELEMACRLVVMAGTVSLITQTEIPDGVVFRRESIALEVGPDGLFASAGRSVSESAPIPPHLRPCNLNGDNTLDFAGGRWMLSTSSPLPSPLYETWASLDGGATFHIERTPAFRNFRPNCSFLDFDGDGDLDMVAESTRIMEGGPREAVNRYLTETRLHHTLRILPQDRGAFHSSRALAFNVVFELDAPPITGGPMLDRYQAGALLNLTGDFNGDGFLDLVSRKSATRLEVHLARGWSGFDLEPAAEIGIPANADVAVADINGDGYADILLQWVDESVDGSAGTPQTVAYFALGDRP